MLISMVGCNAVGKSTAGKRYLQKYPNIDVVAADTQQVFYKRTLNGCVEAGWDRVLEWKGTSEQKRELTQEAESDPKVVLVESARTTHLEYITRTSPVIIVTCNWELYRKHMQARCAAKNKKYRSDYWTDQKLQYEASVRYLNYAQKHLGAKQWKHFEITSQENDWPAIDEYFGSLFRKLYNQLVAKDA